MKVFKYSDEQLEILKSKDEVLKEAINKIGRINREINDDLFYTLINSIASQQISTKAAISVWNKIVDLVKVITPENIIKYSIEELQKCGLSFRKARYIYEAAERFASGEFDVEYLKTLSDDDLIKELVKLKGVGVWTAEMLLIFSLNRMDVLSLNDLGIIRGLKRLYNLDEISKEKLLELKDRYRPYGSIASLYLWELAK
ncbi:MAG TPA: DNA-3-methyladenine glycosylase 2 family protein [Bacilli bacterium]